MGTEILRKQNDIEHAVDYVVDAVQDMVINHSEGLNASLPTVELFGMAPELLVVAITVLWYHREKLENLAAFYERASRALLVYDYKRELDALAIFRELLRPPQ
jgi:hypothetical protein